MCVHIDANPIVTRFKRYLAIILLLILPLQSTLAAVDSCCTGMPGGQSQTYAGDGALDRPADSASSADAADRCTLCDICHHGSATFLSAPASVAGQKRTCAPVPSPELPIISFIPDVPSRPDRA